MGWFEESVVYQIYPLGFVGAPKDNDKVVVPRIRKVLDWIPYFEELGITAVLFNPVFDSDHHGYDTRSLTEIDCRLGTNEDFAQVCRALHEKNIHVILDGVFNHVGRGFFAFQDVLQNRENSKYKDWFYIQFQGNSNYNDGLYYEGWEGHYELVKLNLQNPEVINYIFDSIRKWREQFLIDGIRLDVAYCLDKEFLKKIHGFAKSLSEDFVLIGEVLFGDYNLIMNNEMLDSCTNYECYKGIYSSFNELNFFEISYAFNRQSSDDPYSLYKGKHMLDFVDNHDVSRIATMIRRKEQLKAVYGMLFTMPGVPCIYYGSEWGIEGDKNKGDDDLRPAIEEPVTNELSDWIRALCKMYQNEKALAYGSFRNVTIRNKQYIYERAFEGQRILVMINGDDHEESVPTSGVNGEAVDVISKEKFTLLDTVTLPPYSIRIVKL